MSAAAEPLSYETPVVARTGRVARWVGWGISGLVAAMLGMGGVMDLLKPPFVVEGVTRAGFREEVIVPLGAVTLLSVILFLIPRTALIGAVLLTAYLGGAVATHVRMAEYGQMVAPVIVAVVMWVAFALRDRRVRPLLPF